VGRFRDAFESASEQILILKKYKGLHDCLHELQRRLPAIEDKLLSARADRSVFRTLGRFLVDLKWLAKRAHQEMLDLPNVRARAENEWIEEFDRSIDEMEDATRVAATVVDFDRLLDIPRRLSELLTESPRINRELVHSAADLRLDRISDIMVKIADRIRRVTKFRDAALQKFEASASAIVRLRYRLEGLVEEHSEWQWLDKELQAAALSQKYRPEARIPRWQEFEGRITALCDLAPTEPWSIEIKDRMRLWMEAASARKPKEAEKAVGETTFLEFSDACSYRFFKVDTELKDLSTQVTDVGAQLSTLLLVFG